MKAFIYLLCCSFFSSCASSTQEIIVGPEQTFCKGSAGVKCYQVKKNDSLAEWETLQGSIAGFDYEPGYIYTLEVYTKKADDDTINTSQYTLKRVLGKKKQEDKVPLGNFLVTEFKNENVLDHRISMNFTEEGQVNGKGVCNRYSGTFTATTLHRIKFSQAATTRMLCKEPALERDFFQTMSAVNKYSLEDQELKLYIDNDRVLTASFNKEP